MGWVLSSEVIEAFLAFKNDCGMFNAGGNDVNLVVY